MASALLAAEAAAAEVARPQFRTDVMAVLSKAGCNMGACHGNLNGKGGLRLSLRGEDPAYDHQQLVRQFGTRRVNPLEPSESLILLKPSGRVAHQGGVRFTRDSLEYQLLHDWIAAGCPGPEESVVPVEQLVVEPTDRVLFAPEDQVQLTVLAKLADGTERDVSRLAVYEPSNLNVSVEADGRVRREKFGECTVVVRYLQHQVPVRLAFLSSAGEGFAWQAPPAANYIDEHIDAKLRKLQITPSSLADDRTFVRRAYLDALGVLPTADEARRFVQDSRPDKRLALIEELLARPEFADHWALKWSDILRNEEKVLDEKGVELFHGWIRDSVANNKPWDEFVRELLLGQGSTYAVPAANYYRANRDPETRAETTARLFLGARLQCARCHNHPFDTWTQDDYYAWAANFARIDYEIIENKRRDDLDKNEFNGEQIVKFTSEGQVTNPRSDQPAAPRLLGQQAESPGALEWTGQQRLEGLARWVTSGDNERFVQSQVNFIWYHLMGRGLVEPVDDFRITNPASNPELLQALADDFVSHGFQLRPLVRRIMTSRTYQLAAIPNESNAEDTSNFSHRLVRRLTAEQLLDAQSQVLAVPAQFAGHDPGIRAGQLPGVPRPGGRREGRPQDGDRFLMAFGKPQRLLACECERSNETTLNQAFLLIGSEALQTRLEHSQGRVAKLAASEMEFAAAVEELYWSALSRAPTAPEQAAAAEILASAGDRFLALQDVAWALLNSKEFVFSH